MNKNFILCFVFFSIFGCAYKEALQLVPGTKPHPQGVSKSICQHYVLGFPTNANVNTIYGAVQELKINEKEIYSIEKTSWPYFWFLVYPTCIEFYMSDQYKIVANQIEATSQMGGTKIQDQQNDTKFSAPEKFVKPGEVTGNAQEDLDRCSELFGVEKKQCRKKIYDYYENVKN